MALKTKCIKKPREASDGWRVSTMSQHTLDDGITPDPEIAREMYDEWDDHLLAPAKKDVGAYKRKEISWEEFERRFLLRLTELHRQATLCSLIRYAERFDITILCVEETPEHCHRRLIAETCKSINPSLETIIE